MFKSLIRPIFRLVTQIFDPVSLKHVHGAPILLPISHGLARCVSAHPFYDSALPALARFLRARGTASGGKLGFIDVGANVGDTAALVAHAVGRENIEFVCIEADPSYIPLLKRNTEALSAQIFEVALGDRTETRNIGIVHARRGTSSLSNTKEGGKTLKVMRLDDLVADSTMVPDILKIDTDGFEGAILRGSKGVMERHSPSIFMEFSPWHLETYGDEEPQAVLGHIRDAGYKAAIVYDNEGYPMGMFSFDDAFIRNLVTYCASRPSFYVDILAMKDEAVLAQYYTQEQSRYPAAPWVER